MEAASKYLTPITLELGGKSPVIIDETADINLAAKRIIFGKYINAGQTCIAPDYAIVHRSKKEELVAKLAYWINKFYPKDNCANIADYPKIINQKHFDRLIELMTDENIVAGGTSNRESLIIEPTVITDVNINSPIMQEEIFGPLLPVFEFDKLGEAISFVRSKPKPLALYFFSENKSAQKKIINELSFGGGCINDVLLHISTSYMPFGGVGESGMGSYHGKNSFSTFTHYKSIVKKSDRVDLSIRYRPYTEIKMKLIKKLM